VSQKTKAAICDRGAGVDSERPLFSGLAPVFHLRREGKPIAAKPAEGAKSRHNYRIQSGANSNVG
jgi:hypothetical protein